MCDIYQCLCLDVGLGYTEPICALWACCCYRRLYVLCCAEKHSSSDGRDFSLYSLKLCWDCWWGVIVDS